MTPVLVTLVHIIAFFGIGLLGATALERRKIINKHLLVITAYAIGCLIYYALFYVYALSPDAGSAVTMTLYVSGVIAAIYLAYLLGKSPSLRKVFKAAVLPVLLIIFSLATVYSVMTFSCHYRKSAPHTPWVFYQACVFYDATGDNVLPQLFGQQLIQNHEYDQLGDWYLADRPPIEIGGVVSILDSLPKNSAQSSAYELFSIILQLSWVAALWALLNAMRILKKNQYYIIAVSSITGFYYYNSIYGWPKMLAASFGIAGLVLLLYNSKNKRKVSPKDWILATAFITLSMLSHGSAIYLIIPLVMYLIFSRRLPSLKVLALCLLTALVLYGPWIIYQQHAAPNPRLAKWQLAGVISADDKRSAPQAIVDSYKKLSLSQWAQGRFDNVKFLFRADYSSYWGRVEDQPTGAPFLVHVAKDPNEHSLLDNIRKQDFFSLFPALGLLNIGWLILLFKKIKGEDLSNIKPLLTISIIGLVSWIFITFIPGSTLNFTNSYAIIMLIFTVLISAISTSSTLMKNLVLPLQFVIFYLVWVYGLFKINHYLSVLFPVTILMLTGLLLAIYFSNRNMIDNDHS